jgi:hypothetical protein
VLLVLAMAGRLCSRARTPADHDKGVGSQGIQTTTGGPALPIHMNEI